MEHRQHRRVPCQIESNFKTLGSPEPEVLSYTTVRDISEGGVRFRSNHFIPVRRRVYFHMDIPKTAPIKSMAELAWIRELPHLHCFEAGARFVEFPTQEKPLLQQFIFQRLITK